MAVSCYDEGICIPTEEAQQTSLRIQQILAYESGVPDTADPLGGSYFIEYLTDSLEIEANKYIAKIDSLGGAVAAIEQGFHQREIQESAYRYQREADSGKRIVVGVNKFLSGHSLTGRLMRVDDKQEIKQRKKLAQIKNDRDNVRVSQTLKNLEETARNSGNTMPVFIECVEAYATLGEICDVLRRVFGTQKEYLVF